MYAQFDELIHSLSDVNFNRYSLELNKDDQIETAYHPIYSDENDEQFLKALSSLYNQILREDINLPIAKDLSKLALHLLDRVKQIGNLKRYEDSYLKVAHLADEAALALWHTQDQPLKEAIKPLKAWKKVFESESKLLDKEGYAFIHGQTLHISRKLFMTNNSDHFNQLIKETFSKYPHLSSIKIQGIFKSFSLKGTDIKITVYYKGMQKTKQLISVRKEPFAAGRHGTVHKYLEDDSQVVKKSLGNLINEFFIGNQLEHPILTKSHHLYLKYYPETDNYKQRMRMEKIKGQTLDQVWKSQEYLSIETILKLILQAKSCCQYLFEKKIVWKDLHQDNIFVTEEGLKLCDFDLWYEEQDTLKRAKDLLSGAMQLIIMIMYRSEMYQLAYKKIDERYVDIIDKKEALISYPNDVNQRIFKRNEERDQLEYNLIYLPVHPLEIFKNRNQIILKSALAETTQLSHGHFFKWNEDLNALYQQLTLMNDQERLECLNHYFDCVEKELRALSQPS